MLRPSLRKLGFLAVLVLLLVLSCSTAQSSSTSNLSPNSTQSFYTFRYKESLSAIRVTDSSSSRQQTRLRSIRHENAEDALGIGIANVYLHPGFSSHFSTMKEQAIGEFMQMSSLAYTTANIPSGLGDTVAAVYATVFQDDEGTLVISFRGMDFSDHNALTALFKTGLEVFTCPSPSSCPGNCPAETIKKHGSSGKRLCDSGCMSRYVRKNPSSVFNLAKNVMDEVLKKYSYSKIFLTGHSLGGGLAQLMALRYNFPSITFATPPIGFYARLAGLEENFDKFNQMMENYMDGEDPLATGIFPLALFSSCFAGNMTIIRSTQMADPWSHTIKHLSMNSELFVDAPEDPQCLASVSKNPSGRSTCRQYFDVATCSDRCTTSSGDENPLVTLLSSLLSPSKSTTDEDSSDSQSSSESSEADGEKKSNESEFDLSRLFSEAFDSPETDNPKRPRSQGNALAGLFGGLERLQESSDSSAPPSSE